jgi:hypothetical protein
MITEEQKAYMAQLSPMEKKVIEIARSHLESSFSIEKSIGFQIWKKKNTPHPSQNKT